MAGDSRGIWAIGTIGKLYRTPFSGVNTRLNAFRPL